MAKTQNIDAAYRFVIEDASGNGADAFDSEEKALDCITRYEIVDYINNNYTPGFYYIRDRLNDSCKRIINGSPEWKFDRAEELARQICSGGEWDLNACRELCELADLDDEFDDADGSEFEELIYKAADLFGVGVI